MQVSTYSASQVARASSTASALISMGHPSCSRLLNCLRSCSSSQSLVLVIFKGTQASSAAYLGQPSDLAITSSSFNSVANLVRQTMDYSIFAAVAGA